jgi:acyl carrier protein
MKKMGLKNEVSSRKEQKPKAVAKKKNEEKSKHLRLVVVPDIVPFPVDQRREEIFRYMEDLIEKDRGKAVNISAETNLLGEFGLDSVDTLSLYMQLDRQFKVHLLYEEALSKMTKAGDLADLVIKIIQEKKSQP